MKKISLSKLMIISCAVIFALLVLILSPLYINISANIVLRETPLTDIIYLLIQLFEILAFATAASIIIHAAISQTAKNARGLFGIYCAAGVLRRAVTLFISFITFGYIEDLEIFSTAIYIVFDVIQMFIITSIVTSIARKHSERIAKKQKAAIRLGDSLNNTIDFSKIFSRTNPYARCCIATAVVISATKILTRAIFDIFAGLPEGWIEIASIAVGYLSDLLIFAVAYAICWLITSKLYQNDN